jgi:NitT/TauT family transport system substrate-binding protein
MERTHRSWFGGLVAVGLLAACAPGAAPAPAKPAPPTPAVAPAAPSATAGPAPSAAAPELPTSPAVDLTVATIAAANYAPIFVAHGRGYFKELGLNVELINTVNVNEQLAALAQGQLQVGACSNSIACFNALHRRVDFKIVADLKSGGKTEKSTGGSGIVVRKDLWDNGTIRGPHDLVGRSLWTIAGQGSGQHASAAHWLRRNGIDPRSVEWQQIPSPDLMASMANGAIEAGSQLEPFVTAGTTRGIHHLLVSGEEMHPTARSLYLMYWPGIDRLGPMVGERFMVAYLRAAREYLNAFEYGVDLDAIIDILTSETAIKDPALYRQIKYSWMDPDGIIVPAELAADAELFRELGLLPAPVDLTQAFEDKYRQFAVHYLGPYQPPR